ncbi:MAG: flagellar basal body rod protein FlgF [Gammaproteobacteria bacterium]|nr:flagellar basal body rod protein FlgF [Gammaproteobacteria bacterium]
MDRLIYVAMSGAREAMRAQATTSHNLANISTTGFRALRNVLDSAPIPGAGLPSRVNTVRQPELWNTRQGQTQATGRDLDISIQGQGWLVVQDENGNDAYTRAGNLRVNTNGILETASGQPVRGNGGPVSIPPYEKLFIGDDGQISIVPQGQTAESLVQVDRLRLVNPPALDLVRSGNGLFALRDGSAAVPDPAVRVASGQLESSNVNPAEALAEMIEMSRHYEMQVRAMNTADELDAASARLIRMNG